MRILYYFEKAWILAAMASIIVGFYNLITIHAINNRVYFPFFCAGFCLLIWFNIRGQRRFREKIFKETEDGKPIDKKPV